MHKTLDTQYVYLELQGDLLIGHYKKGIKINLDVAREIVKTRLEFTDYKPVVALAENLGVNSMDKQARDYLSNEGVEGVRAGAIVIGSPVGALIGNFYLSVSKPKIPSRMFTSREAALKWLQKFRK